MAAPVVARVGSRTPFYGRLVLVGVVVGLLLGAMACASVLAAGDAHGSVLPALDPARPPDPGAHAPHNSATPDDAHAAWASVARPDHTSSHDRHDHSDGASMASHPGMSCVVSVDLRVPQPPVVAVSEPCLTAPAATSTEWSADVDPPVPRFS